MTDSAPTIVHLRSGTFGPWKKYIERLALRHTALGILDDTYKEPVLPSSGPISDALQARLDKYQERKSKLASDLLETLDEGHLALVDSLKVDDVKGIYDKLCKHYATKDIGTRFYAAIDLFCVRLRDSDHPNESYTEYASRVIAAINA